MTPIAPYFKAALTDPIKQQQSASLVPVANNQFELIWPKDWKSCKVESHSIFLKTVQKQAWRPQNQI